MTRRPNKTIARQSQPTSLGTRGCQALVILLIVGATVGGIGIAILSIFNPDALNNLLGGLSGFPIKQTHAISGDPSHFDPYKSFAEAQAFAAKDAQLISITANYVRADGTMDLTATYSPGPSTEYHFVHQIPTPANAPPVGAGGNVSGIWYEPVTITAYQPGKRESIYRSNGNSSVTYNFVNDGYSRETDDPISKLSDPIIAPPHCNLAQLWKVAIQTYDASPNAVASIDYTATGYYFRISDTNVSITFDKNCQDAAPRAAPSAVPQGLSLLPLCSPDPNTYRVWQIRNSTSSDIQVWWIADGINNEGQVVVPAQQATGQPGEVIFQAPLSSFDAATAPTTIRIFVNGKYGDQVDMKSGSPDRCPATQESAPAQLYF